jgi:hypothetical protein
VIIALIVLSLFGLPSHAVAQYSSLHPYAGVSMNMVGYSGGFGFGIEGGIQYDLFYLGGEYGIYGLVPYSSSTTLSSFNYIPPDRLEGIEQYYGIHAGIDMKNQYWLGMVFLWSAGKSSHSMRDTAGFLSSEVSRHIWFNVGPDIRDVITEHLTLDLAYTIRRGLKMGVGYIW